MGMLKIAFLVVLAFGSLESQAASVLDSQNPDIFLAVKEGIKVVKNIVSHVEKSIQESSPSIDIIVEQLTPELGKTVKEFFEKIRAALKDEKQRVEFIISEVEKVMEAVKGIKSCTDPVKKEIDKVFGDLENGLLKSYMDTKANHTKEIEGIRTAFKRILQKARTLFETEVKDIIACIKPGNPDARTCLKGEYEKIKKGIIGIVTDAFFSGREAVEISIELVMELVGRATPVVEKFKAENDPILKKVSDCVAKMK